MEPRDDLPLGEHCRVTLQRTLRLPDDGREHPLPPGLGAMTAYPAGDDVWLVPMRREEALWLDLGAPHWRPHALKVGTGAVCALTGGAFDAAQLGEDEQDYLVVPDQPWLDGFKTGDGVVRQFVAVGLGEGRTVEAQLAGGEEEGGLTFSLFAPKPGRFPEEGPPEGPMAFMGVMACAAEPMGLGAGGAIRQEVYEDEHGRETWQDEPEATIRVELVDAVAFEVLTGIPAPPRTVDAATYAAYGLPFFDLVDPARRDRETAERLRGIRSLADLDGRREAPLPIPEAQVRRLLNLRALAA